MPWGAQDSLWTEAKVEELKSLWDGGFSASVIAERLGNGFTRNSVIGKAYRLQLARRVPRQAPNPERPRTNRRKRVLTSRLVLPDWPPRTPKPPAPPPEPPRPRPRLLTIFDSEANSCRWTIVLDNPKTYWKPTTHFCRTTAEDGHPYCTRHVAKAYNKLRGG